MRRACYMVVVGVLVAMIALWTFAWLAGGRHWATGVVRLGGYAVIVESLDGRTRAMLLDVSQVHHTSTQSSFSVHWIGDMLPLGGDRFEVWKPDEISWSYGAIFPHWVMLLALSILLGATMAGQRALAGRRAAEGRGD